MLLVTAALCWGLTSEAQQVVVMGTQYYDAGAGGATDYPVTDLLQMMGRAVRAKDQSGRRAPVPRRAVISQFSSYASL